MMPDEALSSSLGKGNKDFLAQKDHTAVLFSNITSRKKGRKKPPQDILHPMNGWLTVSHFQSWHL